VCSIRPYKAESDGLAHKAGGLTITCPHRFLERGMVFEWVGETMLGTKRPLVLKEIEFLQATAHDVEAKEIGYIDEVLVRPGADRPGWCALEFQAVYFSGSNMGIEFSAIRVAGGKPLYPTGDRRPDFRSSGPKRLMPQLQIKIPTLRRWGKKMAVVVDEPFFDALGEMDKVSDISNCDIAWFVVRLREAEGRDARLDPAFVRFTTLERAVEGLTGGVPVTLKQFEDRLASRIRKLHRDGATPSSSR